VASQATSYSSGLSSIFGTHTSTQKVSTATLTNPPGTTLLSLLSTTSSLLISNQTSTIQNTISSIPFTTQGNSNATNIISEYKIYFFL
jgi:hypothetical protein